jgi:hypothetical protein
LTIVLALSGSVLYAKLKRAENVLTGSEKVYTGFAGFQCRLNAWGPGTNCAPSGKLDISDFEMSNYYS